MQEKVGGAQVCASQPVKKHVIARRAQPDVAIPSIFKHFLSKNGGYASIYGIATPVCALARNDVRFLEFFDSLKGTRGAAGDS